MKSANKLKNIISGGCVINTVLLLAMYVLGVSLDADFIPTLSRVFGILIYSLALSWANSLFFSSKMKLFPRLLIHFFSTAAVFYVAFVLLGGYKAGAGSLVVIFGLYLVVYAVVAALVAAVRAILKADEKETKANKKNGAKNIEYKSIFDGKK